jgi:hypothetical protein
MYGMLCGKCFLHIEEKTSKADIYWKYVAITINRMANLFIGILDSILLHLLRE